MRGKVSEKVRKWRRVALGFHHKLSKGNRLMVSCDYGSNWKKETSMAEAGRIIKELLEIQYSIQAKLDQEVARNYKLLDRDPAEVLRDIADTMEYMS